MAMTGTKRSYGKLSKLWCNDINADVSLRQSVVTSLGVKRKPQVQQLCLPVEPYRQPTLTQVQQGRSKEPMQL